jgi:hypothetical protein
MRQRTALLTHGQQTNRQYNLPESGQKIASKANREGGRNASPSPPSQQASQWTSRCSKTTTACSLS